MPSYLRCEETAALYATASLKTATLCSLTFHCRWTTFAKRFIDMFSGTVKPRRGTEQLTARHNSKAVRPAIHLWENPQVTMSDWEASYLAPRQVRYAALDALVTSDGFRGLRHLHANGSGCRGCLLPLGAWPGVLDLRCTHPDCTRKQLHNNILGLLQHMRAKWHEGNVTECAPPLTLAPFFMVKSVVDILGKFPTLWWVLQCSAAA